MPRILLAIDDPLRIYNTLLSTKGNQGDLEPVMPLHIKLNRGGDPNQSNSAM